MGLLDFFTKRSKLQNDQKSTANSTASALYSTIPDENESKYYQRPGYYTEKAFEGTQFERAVITFEERKKTCIPTKNGLYVAEILLLAMCNLYPNPKNGYPGYWWFQYGIRNVNNALKSLEKRGFIRLASASESLPSMTVSQLKDILARSNLPTTGKKTDLLDRIRNTLDETDYADAVVDRKYLLTELGKQELNENEYVLYMHRHPRKTTEDATFGPVFNVWEVNKKLGNLDKSNWRSIVDAMERNLDMHRNK